MYSAQISREHVEDVIAQLRDLMGVSPHQIQDAVIVKHINSVVGPSLKKLSQDLLLLSKLQTLMYLSGEFEVAVGDMDSSKISYLKGKVRDVKKEIALLE